VRITGITLGPRHVVPLPEPGRLQRVHREHPIAGGDQRPHPRTPIRLDAHRYLQAIIVTFQILTEQGMQSGHPDHPFGQPRLDQLTSRPLLNLDTVVVLSPVTPTNNTVSPPVPRTS
jgi:hypothetical protein